MTDTATTWANLLTRLLTGVPGNIAAEDMRAIVNTTDRTIPRQLTVQFTGADVLIPDFVDTPGDETGELVLDFGTGSNSDIDVVNGVVEVLNASVRGTTAVTLSFEKTGGGGAHEISVWFEVSADSGATWTTVANSARTFEIAPDGQGSHEILFGSDQMTPAGNLFRIKLSDVTGGAGSINIAKPADIVGFRGTVTGFAAKANFSYILEQIAS